MQAHNELVAGLLLAVGETGGAQVVEYDLEHFEILGSAESLGGVGVSVKDVPDDCYSAF